MESPLLNPEVRQLAEDAAKTAKAAGIDSDSEEAFRLILESEQRIPRLASLAFLGTLTLVFEADKLGLTGDERKQWMIDQVLGETAKEVKDEGSELDV